jgi:hypothetical protein
MKATAKLLRARGFDGCGVGGWGVGVIVQFLATNNNHFCRLSLFDVHILSWWFTSICTHTGITVQNQKLLPGTDNVFSAFEKKWKRNSVMFSDGLS